MVNITINPTYLQHGQVQIARRPPEVVGKIGMPHGLLCVQTHGNPLMAINPHYTRVRPLAQKQVLVGLVAITRISRYWYHTHLSNVPPHRPNYEVVIHPRLSSFPSQQAVGNFGQQTWNNISSYQTSQPAIQGTCLGNLGLVNQGIHGSTTHLWYQLNQELKASQIKYGVLFPLSLTRKYFTWYSSLPPNSIQT